MSEYRHRLMDYVRGDIMPHRFCVGCGCGTVLNAFVNAVEGLGLEPTEMVCVSGIGCSSWIPSPYFKSDTLHTTHGRPIAFARVHPNSISAFSDFDGFLFVQHP